MKNFKFLTVIFIFAFYIFNFKAAEAALIVQAPKYIGLTNGLVGYWSFDGKDMAGNTAYDRSGQGNNGTLTSGPTRAIGKIGQGLSFDGVDDYVDAGDTASLSISGAITISAWIKLNGAVQSNRIASKSGGVADRGYELTIEADYTFHLYLGGVSPAGDFNTTGTTVLSANRWYHVVGVYNPSVEGKVYLDGIVEATNTTSVPSSQLTPAVNFNIGRRTTGSYFPGLIDDVRIYNRALSADEIKRLYRIGATLKINTSINNDSLTRGLVGYWSFDGKDMAGNTAYDRSGNANNGTLTNGPKRAIGKIGQGLSFDGSDDYISISNFCPSISNTAGTISAWVKPDVDNQATDNNDYIFNCQAGHQPSLFILGGSIPDYEFRRFTARTVATTRPRANVWVHLIATWNTSIQTIYVNGVQEDSDATVSTTQSGAGYIGIFGGTTGSWDGLIDDVRVYNRALSASEIQRLYNLGR